MWLWKECLTIVCVEAIFSQSQAQVVDSISAPLLLGLHVAWCTYQVDHKYLCYNHYKYNTADLVASVKSRILICTDVIYSLACMFQLWNLVNVAVKQLWVPCNMKLYGKWYKIIMHYNAHYS